MSMRYPNILNQIVLSNTVRRLWVDNNIWVWALIYSVLLGVGDQTAILGRLGRVGEGMGVLFSQYYGEEAGRQVAENYRRYIQELFLLMQAYRDGDVTRISGHREALYTLADELATLYARVNRFWDLPTIQILLYELINNMESGLASIVAGDYQREIEAHDQFMEQAYRISDEIVNGLLRQFQF